MGRLRFLLAVAAFALWMPSSSAAGYIDPWLREALETRQSPHGGAARHGLAVNAAGELDVFIEGTMTRGELEARGVKVRTMVSGICTAFVPISALEILAASEKIKAVTRAWPVEPALDESVPLTGVAELRGLGPNFLGLNGEGVIVGVIDTGFDLAHDDFKNVLGHTRVLSAWDQEGTAGHPPVEFGYGSEWTQQDIDNDLVDFGGDPHGTHVLGIAAGNGGSDSSFTYAGMAPKADLVLVRPNSVTTTKVVDAVKYVFARADSFSKYAVVNMSFGSYNGPHDGSSCYEKMISALTGPGRAVVVAAGNEGTAANRHANLFAAGSGTSIAAQNLNENVVEAYYNFNENLTVRVTSPDNSDTFFVYRGNAVTKSICGRTFVVENGLEGTTTSRSYKVLIKPPAMGLPCHAGSWTITFIPEPVGAAIVEVDLWGFRVAGMFPESIFSGQTAQKLIREPGNCDRCITVGAWISKDRWTDVNSTVRYCDETCPGTGGECEVGNIAAFSSPGPTRDGRSKPEISAPGSVIASAAPLGLETTECSVNDGGLHVVKNGTSMAAPHVTGAIALLMQRYGSITPAQIRTYLVNNAFQDAYTGAGWSNKWGNGKLRVVPDPQVTFPNEVEQLAINQQVTLSWHATDWYEPIDNVKIELSRNGPTGTFETVSASTPNDGAFDWTVTGPATSDAYIRITTLGGEEELLSDLSDVAFGIAPDPHVLMPNYGEQLGIQATVTLQWQATDWYGAIENIKIELSRTGPTGSYETLVAATPNDGAYDWTVTGAQTSNAYLRITTLGSGGPMLSDMSDVAFSIVNGGGGGGLDPAIFELTEVAPNPAKDRVDVSFSLPRKAPIRISVSDIQGRTIAVLANRTYTAGVHRVSWNLAGDGAIPPGLYFLNLQTPDGAITRRIVTTR